jgi:hypothetical protein
VETKLTHPIDDAELPSYRHPELREYEADLEMVRDVFESLRGSKSKYLAREPAEPPEAYEARLGRSVFSDFFRSSIEAFAGVLTRFNLVDPPDSFEQAADNIDMEGNDITSWWMAADSLALRDGGVAIQVEMPPGTAANAADEAAQGRRPYLVLRPRSKVLNWRTSVTNGVEQLELVTFLEMVEVPDGAFGVKREPRYRVITRGEWFLFRIDADSKGKATAIIEEQGPYLGPGGQLLPMVPVVWYSADIGAGFGRGDLPLRQVAEHNVEHFQRRSDLREKDHKCCLPVPVVIGRTPPAPGEARRPLVLGPNTCVELDQGGSFTFAEPSASSLAESRAQIQEVEKLIARQTLGFLYGDSSGTKTATQAGLESAQTEACIKQLGSQKASVMQSIFALWVAFTGEPLAPGAGLQMSSSIYDRPLEPADVAQLQQLAGGEVLMSQESAVEILQRRGINTATTSVDEELERIRREEPEPADPVGLNDLGMLGDLGNLRRPPSPPTDERTVRDLPRDDRGGAGQRREPDLG